MYTDIVINATPYENRIAVVERGNLLEFHLERPSEKGLVGNIYQGKVVRVLPGMQAAFVDIGLDRTGFLYVDDIDTSMSQLTEEESGYSPIKNTRTNPAIEDLVKEGQTILVQIAKEPIGSKGARLTCHITLPCRNLVFMPLTVH
ncbi:MAG: S1 RNA-binding domain-containing protein, partial [Candidatus Electrothrix sp. AUS4]|nr:S1 RNA-binding domain-containing protein [Candidatus Electrothrix sp. AUS4]